MPNIEHPSSENTTIQGLLDFLYQNLNTDEVKDTLSQISGSVFVRLLGPHLPSNLTDDQKRQIAEMVRHRFPGLLGETIAIVSLSAVIHTMKIIFENIEMFFPQLSCSISQPDSCDISLIGYPEDQGGDNNPGGT